MKHEMVCIVATICCLVAFVGFGHCQEETYQLDPSYHRFVDDYQQSFGSIRLPQTRTRPCRRTAESIDGTETSTSETSTSDTTLDFTPQYIKDRNNATKNYAIMITADWCKSCKPMYRIVNRLRKDGYIFYVFDTTRPEFKDYATLYHVKVYPTFIVYDNGKEINRTFGRKNEDWFTQRLIPKDEQIEIEPKEPVNIYHGI